MTRPSPHLQTAGNTGDDGKTLADFIPGALPRAQFAAEGTRFTATAGKPCTGPFAEPDQLIQALKTIYDPEIPVNIYDLGLIYRLDQGGEGAVEVDMTLTAPGCPVAGTFPGQVAETLAALQGVGQVSVTLVWDPPWTKGKMSDAARLVLDI